MRTHYGIRRLVTGEWLTRPRCVWTADPDRAWRFADPREAREMMISDDCEIAELPATEGGRP